MLTDVQKKTIQAIVNIFETGKLGGDYGCIALLPDDPGHLTYGRSQASLGSGNLHALIGQYCARPGAASASALRPFLGRLVARDSSLDTVAALRDALCAAARDPVMHRIQDDFFDRCFWHPALRDAQSLGIATALGIAVVYDSHVHGAWPKVRDVVVAKLGLPSRIGSPVAEHSAEQDWIREYVATRRNWLGEHPNPLLRRTVYRMDAFRSLLDAGNWDLALPITVRGVTIGDANRESARVLDEQARS